MHSSMKSAIQPCIFPWNLPRRQAFFHEIYHSAMHSSRKYAIISFCHSKRSLSLTCFNKTLGLQIYTESRSEFFPSLSLVSILQVCYTVFCLKVSHKTQRVKTRLKVSWSLGFIRQKLLTEEKHCNFSSETVPLTCLNMYSIF
jgi:hypothetical protein